MCQDSVTKGKGREEADILTAKHVTVAQMMGVNVPAFKARGVELSEFVVVIYVTVATGSRFGEVVAKKR